MRALWLLVLLFILLGELPAKTEYYCHPPSSIKVQPVYNGAQIDWEVDLPDSMISYNSNSPGGIWQPGVGHGLGVVFDLSAFPGATLEQLDFLHYSIQRKRGPYKYRIHILDMDNSTSIAIIDSLEAGDAYSIPRYEIGVELGSIPSPVHVGIFVEGLSDTTIGDKTYSFPAVMSDTTDLVPSTSYYCTDMSDPFLVSDPDYTNIYELNIVEATATNLDLDLWINYDHGDAVFQAASYSNFDLNYNKKSPFQRAPYDSYDGPPVVAKPAATQETSYAIFRSGIGDTLVKIGEVNSFARSFVDTHPWVDSTYYYAVAALCEGVSTERIGTEYYQPQTFSLGEVRVDDNGDFIPDKLGQKVYFKGIVSTPVFDDSTLFFVQDATGGLQINLQNGHASVQEGDSVFIAGVVSQLQGMTAVNVDSAMDIQVFASGAVLDTAYIYASQISEAFEGQLVAVSNISFSDPLNWPAEGQSAVVTGSSSDTAVAVYIDADTDIDGWEGPQNAVTIVGVVEQATTSTPPDDGYRIRPRSKSDFITYVGIYDNFDAIPRQSELYQNYPNPFNPTTAISYRLSDVSQVDLSVYNVVGQKVATLVSKKQAAGSYTVNWDASNFASGIYYYRLSTDQGFMQSKKLLLLK